MRSPGCQRAGREQNDSLPKFSQEVLEGIMNFHHLLAPFPHALRDQAVIVLRSFFVTAASVKRCVSPRLKLILRERGIPHEGLLRQPVKTSQLSAGHMY